VPSRWIDPARELGIGTERAVVPSFEADLLSPDAASVPISSADRLLSELARAVASGRPVEEHPAVLDPPTVSCPPLSTSFSAARAPTTGGFSRFEGKVGAGLSPGVFGELSPTRLEDYATCPRLYLLARQLRLQNPFRPEDTEEMEARDRGTLVHEILACYVRERLDQKRPPSLDRLLEIAEERFSLAEEEGRCGPPLIAAIERANLVRELRQFVEEDTLTPVAAEIEFGGPLAREDVAADRLEASPANVGERMAAAELGLPNGKTLRFTGKIDRIDVGPGDSVVVSDYKTGRQRPLAELRKDPVVKGTKLQLPIYALAAKAHLQPSGPVRARYWLTSSERGAPSWLCTLDDRLVDRLREVLTDITNGIEGGAFPGYPGEESYIDGRPTFENCRHCDFDRVCPTDRDRRWTLLRESPEVKPIVALAQTPETELQGIVHESPLDLGQ
jgi:ATP-dependent helicase/nuclease subunit B